MNKQLHTFHGMSEVKTKYVASRLTDTQFAAQMSATGQQYSCAQVRSWRQVLGITNNTAIDARDHKIIQLKNALTALCAAVRAADIGLPPEDSPSEIIVLDEECSKCEQYLEMMK